ncbi:MAG: asparagine synthase-related protein, partial [Armatimonadota bacterium]|nr:asparagine synthase-related protein [Armatimonadota bacterium]
YARWGEECAAQLIGDFAFAIWDRRERKLFCARDALGVKPLHYARWGACVCVATEAQQCLAHPDAVGRLDEVAVVDYLANNCADEERTLFEGVRRVPLSYRLTARGEGLRLSCYWRLDADECILYRTDEEYADHFLEVFRRAVTDRLRTVSGPVALLMSGGLDSGSIAAVAQRALRATGKENLLACSFVFPSLPSCDESTYLDEMGSRLGIDRCQVNVEKSWLYGDLENATPSVEHPFTGWDAPDREAIGCVKARGARVLLTGHVARYTRLGHWSLFYADALLRGNLRVVRQVMEREAPEDGGVVRALYRHLVWPVIRHAAASWFPRVALAYLRARAEVPPWIPAGLARKTRVRERLAAAALTDHVRDVRRLDGFRATATDGVGRAVGWLDRVAAAAGIECRHPFLDRRVVEYLFSAPPERVHGERGARWIIRNAMRGILPDVIRMRLRKTLLGEFVEVSLREQHRAAIVRLFDDPVAAQLGFVDASILRDAYDAWANGSADERFGPGMFWPTITLEVWLRKHFCGEGVRVLVPGGGLAGGD